ncbi:MAG: protein kinase [Archangium sp.]|nr:protein kinase [Archangium sp.]
MAELEFILEAPERGRVVAFPSKSFIIGSDDACQVCFKSALVSPRHAEVVKDTRGEWWIRDLIGTGAVVVNNNPVLDERLNVGDKLRVGDVLMTVRDSGVNAHARTRSGDQLLAVDATAELQPETVIDQRYKIIKRIATGGMGEVYRAVHVELGKALALKVMLPELSRDADFVGRFKREAIASSRIGQQNIIDISDFGRTADGRFYFVMEFVDGKTLIKHRKEGPFSFQRVVHVGLQIARALAAAHTVGIVHRDLKPENIMLVQRPGQPDFVKVLDFGIAKVISSNGTGAAFTAIGSVVGTPQYMAPEQAGGLAVDARSDIYSMGLILHELVRGKPTFVGDSAVELMSMQLATPPPALTSPHGQVPRALEQIIAQMLQKAPEDRPASMEAVVTALEAVASYPTPTARTAPLPAPASLRMTREEQPLKEPVVASVTRVITPSDPGIPRQGDPAVTSVNAPRLVTMKPPPARAGAARPVPAPENSDSAVDLAAVRPSRTPLLVGGLLVLVALLAVGVVLVGRPSGEGGSNTTATQAEPPLRPVPVEPDPPKPQPPAVIAVKLGLETVTPPHVEVYEDDVMLGSTPLTISRPQGTITSVRFEAKGFVPLTRKVRFESDTTLRLELEKETVKVKKPVGKPRPPDEGDLMDLPD